MAKNVSIKHQTIIQPSKGWQPINWRELWQYKDLFYFLVWRDVKTRYAQSVLGIGWAVIQPIFSMIVFTIVFGKLAKINSDGVPYAIFSYTALVPWTYFSGALSSSSGSLLSASGMMTKVYFPRLVIPLAPVMSKLIDFCIAFIILLGLMTYFGFYPTIEILFLPFLIFLMMLTASGMGMWLTAMSIQYRDIKYAMGFFVQLMMYGAPVVYPASNVPEQFRILYGCFPMAGVIEGFRSILLQTNPIPWDLISVGTVVAVVLFISGAFYFRRMEQYFADVA
jgi:lipopolysaccharide transport system permease protein